MILTPSLPGAPAPLNTTLSIDDLIVSRLYGTYLPELGFGFCEMMIIGHLADGSFHAVSELESQLGLLEHVFTASLEVLKEAKLVAFQDPSELSVQLTRTAMRLGSALLVVQANVDLDFGVASESIARIRNALISLARKRKTTGHE